MHVDSGQTAIRVFRVLVSFNDINYNNYLLLQTLTNVPYQRNRPYGGTFFDSDEIADNFKSYFAEIGAELAKEISQDDA